MSNKGVSLKYRISECPRTEKHKTAAKYLMDDVYIRICDLDYPNSMLAADLYYHKIVFRNIFQNITMQRKYHQTL